MTDNSKLQAIVTDGLKNGLNKTQIVGQLFAEKGGDLQESFKLYNELAKSSGLLLSKEDKDALVVEIAKQYSKEGTLDRVKATDALIERARVSKSTAESKLRDYCTANGIAFPFATRQKRDLDAVKNAIAQWHKDNVDKSSMIAGLVEHFGYTENSAADAYRKFGKDLGFVVSRTSEGREKIAAWFKENGGGERKDVVKRLADAFNLTKNTADGYYGMYLFALTYCGETKPSAE